jgi:hypothetical protein
MKDSYALNLRVETISRLEELSGQQTHAAHGAGKEQIARP